MNTETRDKFILSMYQRGLALREIQQILSSYNLTYEGIRWVLDKRFGIKYNRKHNPNKGRNKLKK